MSLITLYMSISR